MKVGIYFLIVVALTACAAQPARPRAPPPPTPMQTMINTCDLSGRPELQVLNGKFPLSLIEIQQPGISLLSTERGPTPDEQAALAVYDQLNHSCVQAQANFLLRISLSGGTDSEAHALQQKIFASEQNHLADLYQGRETFAQYTRAVNAHQVALWNGSDHYAVYLH